jgi:N utilization substance protein A
LEKILDIIDSIANEKGLRVADVTTALEKALVNTAKKSINPDIEYDAVIDKETKSAKIFQIIKVVDDNNIALDDDDGSVMSLSEAKELDEDVEVEDELRIEYSLDNLGRTAVATLYKEIEFHIQRLIEDDLYGRYQELIGQSVSGPVVHVDNLDNTYIEINEVRLFYLKRIE